MQYKTVSTCPSGVVEWNDLSTTNPLNSHQVPCARAQIDGSSGLNTCRFHSSGSHVAVGDMGGKIHLYDLNEVMVASRANDWNLLSRTIEEARPSCKESAVDGDMGSAAVAVSN
ncbi:unnamed protein product [Echinostoma caproni]|uniref:WD_REPEATS_REGION domain-containing protein n=1 Tax=Echinostoma caproni TaxID=27848 RepID=A0A183AAY5_9TREM|nr:unnamed protein product [Echinostoma caproni]